MCKVYTKNGTKCKLGKHLEYCQIHLPIVQHYQLYHYEYKIKGECKENIFKEINFDEKFKWSKDLPICEIVLFLYEEYDSAFSKVTPSHLYRKPVFDPVIFNDYNEYQIKDYLNKLVSFCEYAGRFHYCNIFKRIRYYDKDTGYNTTKITGEDVDIINYLKILSYNYLLLRLQPLFHFRSCKNKITQREIKRVLESINEYTDKLVEERSQYLIEIEKRNMLSTYLTELFSISKDVINYVITPYV